MITIKWAHRRPISKQGCRVGIFKVKFQKFGLFKSSLAWKNGVWHVRHSLAFFWPFLWCWNEKTLFGLFWNLWLSYCCRLAITELFLRTKVFSFLRRSHSRRCKRLCRLSDVTGQRDILPCLARLRKLRHIVQRLISISWQCCYRKINIRVYAKQVSCCVVQSLCFF